MPFKNIKKNDNFWLKNVYYSLKDIFCQNNPQNEKYCNIFEGGTLFQAFLDACYYHRWHSPINGTVI